MLVELRGYRLQIRAVRLNFVEIGLLPHRVQLLGVLVDQLLVLVHLASHKLEVRSMIIDVLDALQVVVLNDVVLSFDDALLQSLPHLLVRLPLFLDLHVARVGPQHLFLQIRLSALSHFLSSFFVLLHFTPSLERLLVV